MKVTRLLHVSLNTRGALEPTRAFYADLLGLPEATRPWIDGVAGRWLAVGEGQLHLVDAPSAGGGVDPVGPHFCLGVEDVEAAVAELDEAGVPYVRGMQGEGVVQVWFQDPSGATVELQEDRPGG